MSIKLKNIIKIITISAVLPYVLNLIFYVFYFIQNHNNAAYFYLAITDFPQYILSGLITTIILFVFSLFDKKVLNEWFVIGFVLYSFVVYYYIYSPISIGFVIFSLAIEVCMSRLLNLIKKFNLNKYLYRIFFGIIVGGAILIVVFSAYIITIIQINQSANLFIKNLIEGVGGSIGKQSKEYPDELAVKIISELLLPEEAKIISPLGSRPGETRTLLYDFGANGKILSLQKYFDLNSSTYIDITIDKPDGIKLRHKTIVGPDLSNLELIKKESNYPEISPFKRAYLFVWKRGENGRMKSYSLFEGSMVEIHYNGLVDENSIRNLEKITWNIFDRLQSIYENDLKPISDGPLFANNPIITRPDMPDPDLIK